MSDISSVVGIELQENSLQLLFCDEISHVDGSCKEITVIYLLVSVIVELCNDLFGSFTI